MMATSVRNLFSYTTPSMNLSREARESSRSRARRLSREELAAEYIKDLLTLPNSSSGARAKLRKTVEECCTLVTDFPTVGYRLRSDLTCLALKQILRSNPPCTVLYE